MYRTHRKQENEQGREGGQQVGWQTRAHRLSDKETEKGEGKRQAGDRQREEMGRTQTERPTGTGGQPGSVHSKHAVALSVPSGSHETQASV